MNLDKSCAATRVKFDSSMNVTTASARRAYWLKTLHQWHWISSAICLLGMLLFGATGLTLNHSDQLESKPTIRDAKATASAPLLQQLVDLSAKAVDEDSTPDTPVELRDWVQKTFGADISQASAEWSERELYLSMERPGMNSWISINLHDGGARYQVTDRGWVALFNDLHKGRHAGQAWMWFIDLIAVGCLMFAITGLLILKMHASNRPATWPLVGLGILVPVLIALLFIH